MIVSLSEHENRKVLSRCLKTTTDGADATWRDRSFQTVAPETGNARLLTVKRLTGGTSRWWKVDCSCCLDVMSHILQTRLLSFVWRHMSPRSIRQQQHLTSTVLWLWSRILYDMIWYDTAFLQHHMNRWTIQITVSICPSYLWREVLHILLEERTFTAMKRCSDVVNDLPLHLSSWPFQKKEDWTLSIGTQSFLGLISYIVRFFTVYTVTVIISCAPLTLVNFLLHS